MIQGLHTVNLAVLNTAFPSDGENIVTQIMKDHVGDGNVSKSVVKGLKSASRASTEPRSMKVPMYSEFTAANVARWLDLELEE